MAADSTEPIGSRELKDEFVSVLFVPLTLVVSLLTVLLVPLTAKLKIVDSIPT